MREKLLELRNASFRSDIQRDLTVAKVLGARLEGNKIGIETAWKGYNVGGLTNTFTYMEYLDQMSADVMNELVIDPLTESATRNGMILATPGNRDSARRDYFNHITVANGAIPEGIDDSEIDRLSTYVKASIHPRLTSMEFTVNEVVLNGGGMIYACVIPEDNAVTMLHDHRLPASLTNVRTHLLETYEDFRLGTQEYRDIAHTVCARIMGYEEGMSEKDKQASLTQFTRDARRAHVRVRKAQPHLRTGTDFYSGRSIHRARQEEVTLLQYN